jgi:paired small multidrug resistance pump
MGKYWIIVVVCAIIEVGWVMGLKHASSVLEWIATIIAIIVSFGGLIYASSKIPVGTCYAVFVGLGTAGTVIVEMLFFGEPFKMIKILLILVLLIGVLGLKLLSTDKKAGVTT